MQIFINDKELTLADGATLAQAAAAAGVQAKQGVAVAVNLEIVPAAEWNKRKLSQGDKITLIKAFYGG